MKTQVIEVPSNHFNQQRKWKQFNTDPKRYDDIIDKIVPLMISNPYNYIEQFKKTFGKDSDVVIGYNTYSVEDKEYFKARLKEKYEQYLYCFFPNMYDEYLNRQNLKEIQEEKQNHSSKYNNFQSNIFIF